MAIGYKTGGRKKGSLNKTTSELKYMILNALEKVGGEQYLVRQATANPTAFMTMLGKVLPLTLSNDPENPINPPLSQSDTELMARCRQSIIDDYLKKKDIK
jgi:hypothetical protein